jgi:hypothetical protein
MKKHHLSILKRRLTSAAALVVGIAHFKNAEAGGPASGKSSALNVTSPNTGQTESSTSQHYS